MANRVRHPVKMFLTQTGPIQSKNENLINSAPVQQNTLYLMNRMSCEATLSSEGKNYIAKKFYSSQLLGE